MGYFKEKLIEQMGHDLDNPFRFLYAQARKAEKATQIVNWWEAESEERHDVYGELHQKSEVGAQKAFENEYTHQNASA